MNFTKRARLALCTAAVLFTACNPARAQDPGYGAVQTGAHEFPNGTLGIRIYPWEEIRNIETTDWVLQHRLLAVPGEKVLDQQHRVTESNVDHAWFVARDLRRKRGQKRFSLLLACSYDGDGEHARLIDVFGKLDILLQNRDAVFEVLDELARDRCEERPSRARHDAILAAIRTAPGKGAGPGQIETVLVAHEQGYDGDFLSFDTVVYALFKDGMAYHEPSVPLDDLDLARSRELEPQRWRKWRRADGAYQLYDAEDQAWRNIDVNWTPEPAKSGTLLDGVFDYIRASGSMWYGSYVSRGSYTLRKNGTYSASTSGSFGGSIDIAEMGSVDSFSYCDETGGETTITGSAPGVFIGSNKARSGCGDGKAGRYEIESYTITLFANNGVTNRYAFYRLTPDWLVIGGQDYTRD